MFNHNENRTKTYAMLVPTLAVVMLGLMFSPAYAATTTYTSYNSAVKTSSPSGACNSSSYNTSQGDISLLVTGSSSTNSCAIRMISVPFTTTSTKTLQLYGEITSLQGALQRSSTGSAKIEVFAYISTDFAGTGIAQGVSSTVYSFTATGTGIWNINQSVLGPTVTYTNLPAGTYYAVVKAVATAGGTGSTVNFSTPTYNGVDGLKVTISGL